MATRLDEHGQPKSFFNRRKNREKSFRHLHGILEGIAADRRLADAEIAYLQTWLNDHASITDPDSQDLREDLSRILADGVVTDEERVDLLATVDTILKYRGRKSDDEAEAINRLHGFISGIAADGVLVDQEIRALGSWLREHEAFATSFPLDVVLDRVSAVLADRRITEEERADLLETLESLQGGAFMDTGAAGGFATRHTFDVCKSLSHEGHHFCVTGKFACGNRRQVCGTIESLGGSVTHGITKEVSYLLVGTFASRDWVGTAHGRKIEKALEYRDDKGGWPLIVAEEDWLEHIG